jgi:hypothetical protein
MSVGLFLNKKTWYRIEFDSGRTGWIVSGDLDTSSNSPNGSTVVSSLLISEAQAADTNNSEQGIPGFNIWILLLIAFIFVIFGMIAKVAYDEVDKRQQLSVRRIFNLGECIKALIVAPMVFAAFLVAGNFTFNNEIAVLIFFCMAFQNGFFWQTVIPTTKENPVSANN